MQRIAPQNWYRQQDAGDAITLIDEPYIHPFYRCNMWHVRGRDKDMLVDSGMGVVPLREHVALLNERALLTINTHAHFDHIGSQHEFDCRLCHAAEADILAHPTRENTLADPYVSDNIFSALPDVADYDSATYAVKAAPATQLVAEGDIIDLGERHFEVLHLPGHSPGGIGLWEAATGVLITGDAVYDGPLVADSYHSDMDDYIGSMEKLLTLPVRLVHGGHFASFSGARMQDIIQRWLKENAR